MRKPIPYMQFYVADYMGDTTHLTTEQHGAYDLILFNYWHRQKPIDESKLSVITKLGDERWKKQRDVIAEFFDIKGGKWTHKRIEAELKKVREQAKKNKAAGKKSGEARRAKKEENERAFNERSTEDERNVKQSNVKRQLPTVAPLSQKLIPKREAELLAARDTYFKLQNEVQKLNEEMASEQVS